MKEAQQHTDTTDPTTVRFKMDCYRFTAAGTGFQTGAHCGEDSLDTMGNPRDEGYMPKMFPVKTFYTQVLGLTPPTTGYQFDVFDPALFDDGFFNKGRQVIYGDLTKCWHLPASRPQLGGAPLPPPRAEVAWVRPAYVTWGTPNTLTVAGYARNGSGGVLMRWRDVTAGGPFQEVGFQPEPSADSTWSNTIPTSNYCHDYEVEVVYSGSTSSTFFYSGMGSGYCPQRATVTWIQPQWSAGFGPPGSLVVNGTAANGPAGATVKLYWRDSTSNPNGPWNLLPFAAPVASDGSWNNAIPSANFSHVYDVYAKYDAFASRPARYNGNQLLNWGEVNYAAPSAGATVSASSTYGAGYPASAVINGDRKGVGWGAGGGWADATANAYPDWVEVAFNCEKDGVVFNCEKSIDQVNVFTLQDNFGSPADPTETMTFSQYGVTAFEVQYHDGSAWVTVPNGSVSSNNKVWRKLTFAPVRTGRIRVLVHNALSSYSRITEVEALGW